MSCPRSAVRSDLESQTQEEESEELIAKSNANLFQLSHFSTEPPSSPPTRGQGQRLFSSVVGGEGLPSLSLRAAVTMKSEVFALLLSRGARAELSAFQDAWLKAL